MDNTLIATRKGDAKACNKVNMNMCHALESLCIFVVCRYIGMHDVMWANLVSQP